MSRKEKKPNILKSKRFKYGTSAVVFTVVFVAAIIALNVIFTSLAQTYLWYVDMTKSQIYTLRDSAKAILNELEDNTNIEFIFCAPFDKLEENIYQKQVYTLVQNLAREYDFITYSYIDALVENKRIRQYMQTEASRIKTTDVIITNGADYRVHTLESFYTFAESDNRVFGFNGEYKIISAILQMQGEKLIAYFTTNHSETVERSYLWNLFEEAGFDVRTLDLTKEDIDPKAKIVIMNGPKYDLWGAYDLVNEVNKLHYFISNYGSFMVFVDPGAQPMPELDEFLSEWGIKFEPAWIKDTSSAISVDGSRLVSVYPTEGLGASINATLRTFEVPPMTIVHDARPVKILWDNYSGRNVSPILTTTNNAVAFYADDEGTTANGPFNLMTITAEMRYIQNDPIYTYVVAGGTSKFGDPMYLSGTGYGNQDVLYSIMKAIGKEKVPLDLQFKVYEDTSLSITTAEATRWTILFMVVLPLIVVAGGMAVWFRRRHL
ncbi:MAG: GldG family protein [Oscillospiraceae bacterium]|nr:GldG family protein [Oscillospiraceae bacterium]